MRAVFNRHAPIVEKKLKGKPCPWITQETKRTMNRRELNRKAKKQNKLEDWKFYKRLRNRVNNETKQNKATYYVDLMEENKFKPSKFWDIIKELFPTKGAKILTTSETADRRSKATEFCEYF